MALSPWYFDSEKQQRDFILFQSLTNDAYNNYTAIYHLLLTRLRQYRSNKATGTADTGRSKRRPSTIAEQAFSPHSPAARDDKRDNYDDCDVARQDKNGR